MSTIGLALSGGGVLGGAHLGALQALEELGVRISVVTGTSAGAIVAALYAFGALNQENRLYQAASFRLFDLNSWQWLAGWAGRRKPTGLLRGERLEAFLRNNIGDQSIEAAPLPLGICATDLYTGQLVVFGSPARPLPATVWSSDIATAKAVHASCALPILFEPVEHEPWLLADGGLVNNLPVDVARALGAEKVIAVDLRGAQQGLSDTAMSRPVSLHFVAQATLNTLTHRPRIDREQADVTIVPHFPHINILDLRQAQRCVQIGYEATHAAAKQLRALVA
ncbi:MAG: patatin-like phospholipase family protein [Firmicutes bacterium]|nr:patatin-like phospholipase family protein [Bacillota bacterium]